MIVMVASRLTLQTNDVRSPPPASRMSPKATAMFLWLTKEKDPLGRWRWPVRASMMYERLTDGHNFFPFYRTVPALVLVLVLYYSTIERRTGQNSETPADHEFQSGVLLSLLVSIICICMDWTTGLWANISFENPRILYPHEDHIIHRLLSSVHCVAHLLLVRV